MNDQIPEVEVSTEEDQIAEILEHLPTETEVNLEVPSRGKNYFGKKGGSVTVRPIKFGDEKDIASGGRGPDFNPANHLLSKCVGNVEVDELLVIDKLFLLLKIREISYGNDYSVEVACGTCSYENSLTIEIDKLNVEDIPDEMDVFDLSVDLKGIQKEAVVTAPMVSEEKYLTANNIQKDLWRFVKSIGGNENKTVIAQVIPKLPVADVHRLVNALSLSDYGVQPQIRYVCDSCATDNLIALPIDENFFSVT